MRNFYTLLLLIMLPALASADLVRVDMMGIQACGGATLIANPIRNDQGNSAISITFERQITASVWEPILTKPYTYTGNYIVLTATDVTAPTFYRVKAVDMVTNTEVISNHVSINPNTWNVDRGTAFAAVAAYWGEDCGTAANYLQVTTNYTMNGRAPFTIEYKKSSETNYVEAGVVSSGLAIGGIVPNEYYNVRVTDQCGKVSNIFTRLELLMDSYIDRVPVACNDGQITLAVNGDQRYRGVPPYQYSLAKVKTGASVPPASFSDTTTFTNLAPGEYYAQIKDACGNLTANKFILLGAGFPRLSVIEALNTPGDCFPKIKVNMFRGKRPFQYAFKHSSDTVFHWQSDSVFAGVTRDGWFNIKVKDACGQESDVNDFRIGLNYPGVSTVDIVPGGSACFPNIKVNIAGGRAPYTYAIRPYNSGTYTYKTTDTFVGLSPMRYQISVKDACGLIAGDYEYNLAASACPLRRDSGSFESSTSSIGCPAVAGDQWIDMKDEQNNLIFSLNPNNNSISSLCWGVRIVDNPRDVRTDTINNRPLYFMDRNFYIEPAAGTTLTSPVTIRLFIPRSEFYGLLDKLATWYGVTFTPDDLTILKKSGSGTSPVDLEVTNEGPASMGQFTVIKPIIGNYGQDFYFQFDITGFSEFNPYVGNFVALPLRFVSFNAVRENNTVKLDWITTNEVNTDKFDVEWSTDGNRFGKIGTVISKKSMQNNNYSFVHAVPAPGANFYRLKQIDRDGKYVYSNVIRESVAVVAKLVMFPNPASNQLTVQMPVASGFTTLKVIDLNGRILQTKAVNGSASLVVDVKGLKSGLYVVSLEGGAVSQKMSFIKL